MPALTLEQRQAVERIVSPERARFDVRERRVYSHDTGVLPSLVRPLAGSSLADGVAQPESETQLVALALWARWEGIPLVPRGKATSGYGGAVPARGGLVLDLTRLIYPTSAPNSTVGGWLAQGGAGIGSHAYGWFRENVVSARVVGGDGVVRVMAGAELAGVADAEGTTGIIGEVSLRVRPAAELEQTLVGFPTASDLAEAVRLAVDEGLPIWSLSFVNPTMARLKNAGPPKTHHGHPLREGLTLPQDQLLALFVCDAARSPEVLDGLRRIAEQTGPRRMPAALA